ncbi:polymorphic toxin-type HINT domain-containing protein [Saccharothrix luteola]|uniref:polymorphic toxin-type HINT domain-containing protein n=1 Tax=Saccharothrix luteola TaxID=2893018 RepID=UPI001E4E58DE|nr:polymorphic toxin-type HINT domain-containing protein [Saccharothrix luteola]MCC8250035.1 type IV secretion protein Rhs [Saccharothrix luteola]
MLVTAAQAVVPSAANAAGGPSVPLPDTPSTSVTKETQEPRPPDQATTSALRGDQPTGQGSSLPGAGNTQATSLSASASWSVSAYTGTFSWSYPFRVPPVPGGLEPKLALSYSSSAVDGRTSSTNNQASWVGDGWDLTPGFVERTYGSCADDANHSGKKTGDLCWRSDNANASYNGSAGPLIRDDASGAWRPKGDDGSRVEKLPGADNGAQGGEHWKITTVDGTQYFFGSQQDSRSTWTVPVFGANAGEPCHGADFDSSSCTQAWRWNLDKVVDRHGNVVRYYYTPETDNYGFNLKDTPVSYVRGGTLERIDYGLREGVAGEAVGRVVFDVADRCVPGATACDRAHPENWPDVPWDSTCESAPCTKKYSPSFFSTKRLDTVRTQVRRASGLADVDSWKLDHQFPDPGDGGKASLWLKGVTHTGLVGGSITLPQVTFEGRAMANRVKGPTADGYAPLLRYRVTGIVSESGGVVDVHYADPDCVWGSSMPDEAHPEHNASRCFPVRWVPGTGYDPRVDYFHKYVVDTVTQLDRYGSSVGDVTAYEYLDGAAWHYDTSEFTPPDKKTWNEFRGFGRVRVRRGDGKDGPKTLSEQRFHRGMHADTLPDNGSRPVTLTDSEGNARVDEDWLAGYPFEQTSFDGDGGDPIGKTLSWPSWRGPTATRAGLKAYWTGTTTTKSYTALDGGRGWRVSKTDNEFDDVGLPTKVNRVADLAKPEDAKCSTTTYVRNTGAWVLALPSRVQTVGAACDKTPVFPDHAISDLRTSYDGQDFGVAPTKGDITRTEQLAEHPASGPVYVTTSTATYDGYGRPLTVTDPLNRTTKTAYTPTTGGPVTKVVLTNPAGFETATEFEPAWGVPTKATDANLRVDESAYDALGRLTDSWLPNRPRAGNTPNTSFTYLVRNDAPTAVTTKTIGPNGRYTSSVVLHDGLLRPRQSQAPAVGGGRLLADTRYDSHGRPWKSTRPYYNSGAVDTDLWSAADSAVPGMTTTEYDGAGRTTASVFRVTGDEKWRATTGYGGDRVYRTPPPGGTATTVVNDAHGRTAELWQHKGATPTGEHDTTKYTYTVGGQLATTVDPAGNTWSWTYDQRGRMIHAKDPDKGDGYSTYDAAGQLLSTTDSTGQKLVHGYDVLGRRTTLHRDSTTGRLLAKWDYDTAYKGKGMLAAATRYDGDGNAYATKVPNYNPLYQPGAVDVVIPASEAGLADTYTTVFGYNPDGSLAAEGLPKAGNLAAETVMHTYDDLGLPEETSGADGNSTVFIASGTDYTRYGEFAQVTLGTAGRRAWISNYYEDGSRRLKTSIVDAEVPAPMQAKVDYTYDAAGNITGISDAPTGAVPDHQCFDYDHLLRMVEAWTPGNGDCGTAPKKDALGGAAPYWHTYTYDVTGNRTSEVLHGVGTAADVTRTYHYPRPGQAQPHALKSVDTVGLNGTTEDTYTYDATGNTKTRAIAGEPAAHELDWDVEGRLKSDKAGTAITSFVYDADGGRLLRKDPTSVTLYLGSQEIRLDKATKAKTTTRYYSHGGRVVAQRTATGVGGLTWLASDHQGTAQIAVQPGTMKVTKRRALPFGGVRGAAVAWANDRGFVGGTNDANGLTHLGAREYDPSTGRFISVDPLLVPSDPQRLNAYAYANNSPATFSDPSGLIFNCGPDNVGCGGIPGDPPPSDAAKDAWNNRGGPGAGDSSGTTSVTIENVVCGPVRTVFINPDNNADLSGYLLTMTTVQYTGILHTPPCTAVGSNFCFDKGGDSLIGWEETVAVTATKYQCSEHDQTPGCGPFVSQGGPTAGEAFAELGKLIFDPTACVGSGASAGGCTVEIAGILPVGKILKGAKIAGEALQSAVKACHSFVGETSVLMADGSTKPISEVRVGDRVKATDPETGETTDREVTATFVHGDEGDALVTLTVTAQDGSQGTVEGTSWHPVWLVEEQRFVNLGDLKPGQHLSAADGSSPTITAVQSHSRQATVYDLTVDTVHTYYVLAGTEPVLVHNCSSARFAVDSAGVATDLKPLGRGSTGRTEPNSLNEKLAMESAMSNPGAGQVVPLRNGMNDPRWPGSDGWVKMTQNVNGNEIHYVMNRMTGQIDDFKFKG